MHWIIWLIIALIVIKLLIIPMLMIGVVAGGIGYGIGRATSGYVRRSSSW